MKLNVNNLSTVFNTQMAMRGLRFVQREGGTYVFDKAPMDMTVAAKTVKQFSDTEGRKAFIINANSKGFTFGDDDRPVRVFQAFFTATAAFLSRNKIAKVDHAVAIVLTDVVGAFKFAGMVEYHENEENPDEPGNWSLIFTFNEEDITEVEKVKTVKRYLFTSPEFKALLNKVAYDVAGIEFMHDSYMFDACLLVVDTLIQILDSEAVEGNTVEIELEGYFVASVAVEAGVKVFGVVPDGYMKELIKDDSLLEVDI